MRWSDGGLAGRVRRLGLRAGGEEGENGGVWGEGSALEPSECWLFEYSEPSHAPPHLCELLPGTTPVPPKLTRRDLASVTSFSSSYSLLGKNSASSDGVVQGGRERRGRGQGAQGGSDSRTTAQLASPGGSIHRTPPPVLGKSGFPLRGKNKKKARLSQKLNTRNVHSSRSTDQQLGGLFGFNLT